MDRRRFLLTSLAGAVAAPLGAEAQQSGKIPMVCSLWNGSEAISAPNVAAVRQGLKELGDVEGRDVTIVSQYADGKFERFPVLVKELIELKPDVIVAAGPQAGRVMKQATSTVPVVMAVISAPVAEGLVQSLARPEGNITGIAFANAELTAKRLELLKRVIPGATRVAALAEGSILALDSNPVLAHGTDSHLVEVSLLARVPRIANLPRALAQERRLGCKGVDEPQRPP